MSEPLTPPRDAPMFTHSVPCIYCGRDIAVGDAVGEAWHSECALRDKSERLEGALRALVAAHDRGTENDLKRTYGTDWERADEIRQLIRANDAPELKVARALLAESTPHG